MKWSALKIYILISRASQNKCCKFLWRELVHFLAKTCIFYWRNSVHFIIPLTTKDIYVDYRKSGYSKKYLAEHEADITIHKAAKKAFDELGLDKLPTIKKLNGEYAELLSEKKSDYAEYVTLKKEIREMLLHKQNYEYILGIETDKNDRSEHDRSMQK